MKYITKSDRRNKKVANEKFGYGTLITKRMLLTNRHATDCLVGLLVSCMSMFTFVFSLEVCYVEKRPEAECGHTMKELQIEKDICEILQTRASRMKKDRYPHILLHGYTQGHQSRGRPRKNMAGEHQRRLHILLTVHQAYHLANDRMTWRNTVRHMGCRSALQESSQVMSR